MTCFVQLADLHFGAEDQKALDATADWIRNEGVDAIIVAGDLTQRGNVEEFEAAAKWLSEFDVPVLAVPGNHDTPLLNMVDRVKRPFERYHEHMAWTESQMQVGRTFFGGLNTARGWQVRRNWAEGSVRLEHLEDLITEAEDADPDCAVMVCHHPFIEPDHSPLSISTRRGRRASRRLAESGFEFLLYGHIHVPGVTRHDLDAGTFLSVSAGTLSTRTRSEPASFNRIGVGDTDVTIDVVEFARGECQLRNIYDGPRPRAGA